MEEANASPLRSSVKSNPGKAKNEKIQIKKFNNRRSRKSKRNRKSRKATKNVTKKAVKKTKKAKKNRNKKDKKSKKKKSRKSRKNKALKDRKNKSKKDKKKKCFKKFKNRRPRNTTDNCIKIAVDALYNGRAKKASNFDRQSIRIKIRTPIIANKRGKAGDYADLSNKLGGNAVKCIEGGIDLTEVFGVIKVLGKCKDKITAACAAPKVNQEQIDKCKIIVKAFKEGTELCINVTKKEDKNKTCECWEGEEYVKQVANLKGCVIKESEKNVTDRFKECKDAVQTCNSAQKKAAPLLLNCLDAATLKKNIKALEEAKEAVKTVAGTTNRVAANRADAKTTTKADLTCADFIKLTKTCEP